MSAAAPSPRLSTGQRLGYTVGDLGFNLYWQATALFLYFFYTDVMGLSPVTAGFVYGVASLWDAISDPIMGALADRTRTRWGSYRPYLLFGAIPCALSFVLCFWVPPLQGRALVLYAAITLIALRTLYTVANIPFLALSAKLTSDYQERNTISGLRMMFAACGGLAVAFVMPMLVERQGGSSQGWVVAAAALAVAATVILFVSFWATSEPEGGAISDRRDGVLAALAHDVVYFWSILRRNGPLARVFLAIAVSYAAGQMFAKMLLYWFKYGLANPALLKYAIAVAPVAMIIVTPLWLLLARRTSKRVAWLIGLAISAVGVLAFFLDSSRSTTVALTLITLISVGSICTPLMFFSMIPDTVDYNELQSGRRDEAKIFGFAVFAQKAAIAVNAVALGQSLELMHFVANRQQSEATLLGMKVVMCLVPLAAMALTAVVIWRYPLDAARHAEVLGALSKR